MTKVTLFEKELSYCHRKNVV